METALMFTAYELIVCVKPHTTGSELALSGKKQKTIPPSIPRCLGRFYSAKSSTRKLPIFFLKVNTNVSLGTSARQYYLSK